MARDGPAARISRSAVPAAAALTAMRWRGAAQLRQTRPQKGLGKFN